MIDAKTYRVTPEALDATVDGVLRELELAGLPCPDVEAEPACGVCGSARFLDGNCLRCAWTRELRTAIAKRSERRPHSRRGWRDWRKSWRDVAKIAMRNLREID